MPSERFEKLVNTKREKIIRAAIDEFIGSGYEGSSINVIIKNAGISRGSFYTYFEDKEDVFKYVMNLFADTAMDFIVKTLNEAKGDIIEMAIRLFDVYEKCKEENTNEMFGLVDTVLESFFTFRKKYAKKTGIKRKFLQGIKGKQLCKKLRDNSNENFKKYNDEDFAALVELIFTVLFKAAAANEFFDESKDKTGEQLIKWMGFIRKGV